MDDRSPTIIRLDGLTLELRRGLVFIERNVDDGIVFYLSLLDEEIEDRFDKLLAPTPFTSGKTRTLQNLMEIVETGLELTDAIVCHGRDGRIVTIRGGSCTFPLFWSRRGTRVWLTAALPLLDGEKFSRPALASTVAAVCLPGSFEVNACPETPLQGWRRFRRGVATTLETSGNVHEVVIKHDLDLHETLTEETVAAAIRTAFTEYGRSQRAVTSSVLELSGGYDSTLAGAAAQSSRNAMHGISVQFPYYEFRFEAQVQKDVSAALGISRHVLDGTTLFPYAAWDQPPKFDEPAMFVTGIRHAEQVASFAANHKAARIYVGHGGDHLFSTDLTATETLSPLPDRAAFSRAAWEALRQAMAQVRQTAWLRRSTGCFIYEARHDVWIKETFGPTVRTPFTDLAVFRAGQLWSHWNVIRNKRPDKTILAQTLSNLLPSAVTQRKGKVAYDGVWMRAYSVQADHISRTIDRTSAVLEHIGLSPVWLMKRARELADWKPVSDREILAAYGISVWLLGWGIERVTDVAWD